MLGFCFLHFVIHFLQLGKIDLFSNTSSEFDWNDLLSNTNKLAENLGIFFTSLRPPPVQEFFMYNGNMTEWIDKIFGAFEYYNSPDAIVKR